MRAPPLPPDEPARLDRLRRTGALDSEPEPAFDNLARLAAAICGTPIALVTLVDDNRQWFKARVGLRVTQTSREQSFCGHALTLDGPLIVHDAHGDPRFADNPLVVGDPRIRFYAGVPVRTGDGSALGTVCVIDHVPRQLSREQLDALKLLADQVSTELGLRAELALHGPALPVEPGRPDPDRVTTDEQPQGYALTLRPAGAIEPNELALTTGDRLERRYVLQGALGRGGMGYVLAARDQIAGRDVAIKFLRRHVLDAPAAVARFAREARALMQLQSEHVVRVFDVGNTDDGVPYIVMERLVGEDLSAMLSRRGALPVAEAIELMLQACDVVAEAHDRGIVHRDLKPGNLFLVRANGESKPVLKVLDFGIAKLLDDALIRADGDATTASTILGSPHYMAPEQMIGERDVDGRTDVWALGVVLFELLTNERPFVGATPQDLWTAVLTGEPRDPRLIRADLPRGLADVVGACLRRDRRQRTADVWALAQALVPFRGA